MAILMSKFSALVPELIVSDIRASLDFWCEVIGFGVWYERPEENFAYLTMGDAQLMLDQQSKTGKDWTLAPMERPFGRGLNLQLEVPDLDVIIASCEQRGISLYLPPQERWYRAGAQEVGQRQLIVADPDGYLARCITPLGCRLPVTTLRAAS